ncbi:outer membrane protein [Novosphingobium sp. TH158]|uniref:outer membrane protein n=1 Tax=Novosphingobium sp. TH158 TaxID=2067455 RepID=UPI0013041DD7|nr:outer membrane beta-barrel protein [Novosphingobium sp. TH158]
MKIALTLAACCALTANSPAFAKNEWYVEQGVSGISFQSSSDTTDGGAAFGGGGTVVDPKVNAKPLVSIGFGREFGRHLSVGISYETVDSAASYRANYKNVSNPSYFGGRTNTDAFMLTARYSLPIGGDRSAWDASVATGAGLAHNTFKNITEGNAPGKATFLLDPGSKDNFAWHVSGRLSYRVRPNVAIFGEARYVDLGTFTTGTSRTPGGTIGAYQFNAHGITYGAGLRLKL